MKHAHTGTSNRLKKALAVAVVAATPVVAMAGPQGSNRPYAGACDTVGTVIQTEPFVRISFELVCQIRHLGATTGVLVLDVIPTGPPAGGILPTAIFAPVVYVAANGDELRADFSGTGDINLVTGGVCSRA